MAPNRFTEGDYFPKIPHLGQKVGSGEVWDLRGDVERAIGRIAAELDENGDEQDEINELFQTDLTTLKVASATLAQADADVRSTLRDELDERAAPLEASSEAQQSQITALTSEVSLNREALEDEVHDRELSIASTEAALSTRLNSLDSGLEEETHARELSVASTEAALSLRLNSLDAGLEEEVQARELGIASTEAALSSRLNGLDTGLEEETHTRELSVASTEAALSSRLNSLDAGLEDEIQARELGIASATASLTSLMDALVASAQVKVSMIGAADVGAAGTTQDVGFSLVDGNGQPVAKVVIIKFGVFDDADRQTPAVNAQLSAATSPKGTILLGSGTNELLIKTDANGEFLCKVDDTVSTHDFTLWFACLDDQYGSKGIDCESVDEVEFTNP